VQHWEKRFFRLVLLKLDFTILLILCHGFQVDVHGSPSLLQYRKRLVVLDDLAVVLVDHFLVTFLIQFLSVIEYIYLAIKECYSVHVLYFLVSFTDLGFVSLRSFGHPGVFRDQLFLPSFTVGEENISVNDLFNE